MVVSIAGIKLACASHIPAVAKVLTEEMNLSQFRTACDTGAYRVLFTHKPCPYQSPQEYKDKDMSIWEEQSKTVLFCENNVTVFDMDTNTICVYTPRSDIKNPSLYTLSHLQMIVCILIINNQGLMIHGSGVRHASGGLVFTGKSGSGKSTAARLLADQWQVLNDEYIAIMPNKGTYFMHALPFVSHKKEYFCTPDSTPLTTLYFLNKSDTNYTTEMSLKEKFASLSKNIFLTQVTDTLGENVLTATLDICTKIPMYNLYFTNTNSFADFIGNSEIPHTR